MSFADDSLGPLYQQLADRLRDQILNGHYRPGAVIPAEKALGAAAGLGVDAVRDALSVLLHEGLVSTNRGRPAVVRPQPERQAVTLPDGAYIVARMPLRPERARLNIDSGVPLLEVHHGSTVDLWAGDRVSLRQLGV